MIVNEHLECQYHVTVTPLVTGEHHLKIETQRKGAKNPDERHTAFALTTSASELSKLAAAIQKGLR